MSIVLHLEPCDPALGDAKARRVEVTGRLTIGRGADNGLVLPDPQRQLSKNHCIISFDGIGGSVTDTSTNGVFLNQSPDRLPRNVPTPLAEGSVMRLGGYQITIVAIAPSASAAAGAAAPRASDDGLFGDPLAAPPMASIPGDDFSLLGRDKGSAAPAQGGGLFAPVIPDDVDLFGPKEAPKWHGPSQADHTPAEQVFFTPPRVTREKIPDDWDLSSPLAPASGRAPERRPAPQRDFAEPAAPAAAVNFAAGGGDAAAIAAFLGAIGLGGIALSESEKLRMMQVAGEVLAATLAGLSEILAARASTKQEFRIERTLIGATRNNPLKFATSPAEALRAVLLGKAQGFLSGKAAVDEALGDIKSHQLAMLAGMQMALTTVIARFDPEQLEKRLDQRSMIDGILPGARKARNWELFKALYKEIATELEEDFQKAFGAEFARAYRNQIDRL